MKFLKTFENFDDSKEREEQEYFKKDAFDDAFDDMDGTCEPCGDDEDDDEDDIQLPEPPMGENVTLEKKRHFLQKIWFKTPRKS